MVLLLLLLPSAARSVVTVVVNEPHYVRLVDKDDYIVVVYDMNRA